MEKSVFEMMEKKRLETGHGPVAYWASKGPSAYTLVLLHGLTADHTLFEKQAAHFIGRYNLFCWDAPAHGESRPYTGFSYAEAAKALREILTKEQMKNAVFVGQSMGGYIAQTYMKRYPNEAKGFVGVDTSPFGTHYYSKADLWWLRQVEWMSLCFPHRLLVKAIAGSCTYTEEARLNMLAALRPYSKKELCHLMGIGFAGFIEENCELEIPCPAMLLVGQQDRTGRVKQYCEEWHKRTGIPLHIIPHAAHNANYDNSRAVNQKIEEFLVALTQ